MKIERFIERIEGEATLLFDKNRDGSIRFVEIFFPHIRGMEKFLERKPALDALAIAPRVCGICGHAHLVSAAKALESCYENAGIELNISAKAEAIRSLTLSLEIIQNHFKWFYLTLLPATEGFETKKDKSVLTAHHAASLCSRAIAHLAGQWPHTSYALPGGVMCDPTHVEMLQTESLLAQIDEVFKNSILQLDPKDACKIAKVETLFEKNGDFPDLLRYFRKKGWERVGQSHDRFIVLANHPIGGAGKAIKTRLAPIDILSAKEDEAIAPEGFINHAKPVRYNRRFYEAGPLARAMVAKSYLIRQMHRRYKDASLSRITARVMEIAKLLEYCKKTLDSIDLSEPSYVPPPVSLKEIESTRGQGYVEAARGSLLHGVHLYRGKITRYCITTPTQWNLANGTPEYPGVAQKAMIGLPNEKVAEMVFKSFDICSVCTTQ
ncbi:nickel-dependent hydrogenase large subunit [Hydrogenimonas sp.]